MRNANSAIASHPAPSATRTVTGIDVGKHSAKLVVAERSGSDWTVTHATCLRYPEDAQWNCSDLAKLLGPWLRSNGATHARRYVASLASSMVDYEMIDYEMIDNEMIDNEVAEGPPTEPSELAAFAHEALLGVLGNEANLATSDYWICSPVPTKKTLCLAWTSSEYASQISNGLLKESWYCNALEVPAQSLARIPDFSNSTATRSIVADIGSGEITFVFANSSECEYVRNRIVFASETAAEAISRSLGIRPKGAEKLLSCWGLGESATHCQNPIQSLLAQHLSGWLQRLAFEVRRTLQFFRHRYGPTSKCEIVLCGGGSDIRGLPEWLALELGVPARFSELPASLDWKSAEPYSPLYAQALSLTTYGVAR